MIKEDTRIESVTVGATAIEISEPHFRKVIYIRNTSVGGQVITVTFSNTTNAVAGSGFVLSPSEYITDSVSEGYIPYQGEIRAISTAAGGTLSIFER
jgi:hypothetical protein